MPGCGPTIGARCCAIRAGCPPTSARCSRPRTPTPTRCLAPTLGLQKELKREMRARLKEDDSEPPQVDGPWAYYSRFRAGGQRRIYCRKPREGGAGDGADRRRCARRGKGVFSSRRRPSFARSFEIRLELRRPRLRDADDRGPRPRARDGPRRPRRRGDRRHRLDARFAGVSLRRAGREPPPLPRHAASAGDRADRRCRDLRGSRSGLVHRHRADAPRPRGHHFGARPRRLGSAGSSISIIRPRRPGSSRRAGRGCATR